MTALVIVLALLGAAAPIVGTARIYLHLRREHANRRELAVKRGHSSKTVGDHNAEAKATWNLAGAVGEVRNDLVLVSIGFVLSAIATVLSTLV
jgi:hypothetical protein